MYGPGPHNPIKIWRPMVLKFVHFLLKWLSWSTSHVLSCLIKKMAVHVTLHWQCQKKGSDRNQARKFMYCTWSVISPLHESLNYNNNNTTNKNNNNRHVEETMRETIYSDSETLTPHAHNHTPMCMAGEGKKKHSVTNSCCMIMDLLCSSMNKPHLNANQVGPKTHRRNGSRKPAVNEIIRLCRNSIVSWYPTTGGR